MILVAVGTRPEVIKMAPVVHALRRRGLDVAVAATGQHHDWRMMGSFLETFSLEVDHWLELKTRDLLGSFGQILTGLGRIVSEQHPELVLAVGDTTTVVAAAFAARKCGSAFGHVESGLRAFSRELPEEEHRICADAIADLCFAPTRIAVDNLTREHVNGEILLTGNPVLDALRSHAPAPVDASERESILVTVHRQETVDDPEKLAQVVAALGILGKSEHVVWPVHPRTRAKAAEHKIVFPSTVKTCEPLGHREFLNHLVRARLVVTDSGGVQEEAAILGTPCVTVRRNTERPETVEAGVGILSGIETAGILDATNEILSSWERYARPVPHLYGDGRAGEKIADACVAFVESRIASAAPVVRVAVEKQALPRKLRVAK